MRSFALVTAVLAACAQAGTQTPDNVSIDAAIDAANKCTLASCDDQNMCTMDM